MKTEGREAGGRNFLRNRAERYHHAARIGFLTFIGLSKMFHRSPRQRSSLCEGRPL